MNTYTLAINILIKTVQTRTEHQINHQSFVSIRLLGNAYSKYVPDLKVFVQEYNLMSEESLFRSSLTLVNRPKKRSFLMALRWLALLKIYGPNKQYKGTVIYLLPTKQGGHCQGRTVLIGTVLTLSC